MNLKDNFIIFAIFITLKSKFVHYSKNQLQMKLHKLLAPLILLLMLSCKQENSEMQSDMAVGEQMMAPSAESEAEVSIERKLIKNGNVEFETNDIVSTRAQVVKSIEKFKGYTASDQESKYGGRVSNIIVVRLPSKNFDAFLSDATKGVTRFDTKNIDINDVTEEFVDHQARLKTKKELENRYLQILQKAKSVTEMLEVEKQLGELRSEIESVEGRLKYLQSQVSLSTLTITFYQIVADETAFSNRFKDGFRNGWDNLIWFFVFLTNIWPFVIIVIILFFGVRRWAKRRKKI